MHPLLFITQRNGVRLEEIAGALAAIAGGLFFLTAMTPGGRRGGQLAGLCLAAAGVLAVIGLHWGHVV